MRKYKATMILLVACFVACFASLSIFAIEKDVVKVGFYSDGDYMSLNEAGEYVGYNFEYLQSVAKHTGWSYEIIDCVDFENAYSMLKSGEIDLLPALYSTTAREQEVNFAEFAMCNTYTTLNVRIGDDRYSFEDFDAFQGMKVGVIQGGEDAKSFIKYCQDKGITLQIIPYTHTETLLNALESGVLDGVAITHLGKSSTFRSVAQFSPNPIYLATSQIRLDLGKELDTALNTIMIRDPHYENRLYDKYFSTSTQQQVVFTREELAFIKATGVIRAAYDPKVQPLSYTDSATGAMAGISADLFAKIATDSGLQFEFVPLESGSDAIKKALADSVEVFCDIENEYRWLSRNGLYATDYYLRAPIVVISDQAGNIGGRIAMPEGYALSQKISADNPNAEITYYQSSQECFDALLRGEADITYANTYFSDSLLSLPQYERFSVVTLSQYTDEISIGVSQTADPRLFSILDKCIQYTANEKIDEMILKNSLKARPITWRAMVAQYPIQIIGGILLICTAIMVLLASLMVVRGRAQKKIWKLTYRDELTGLWNLSTFRIEANRILEKADSDYALVYTDINHFKAINDAFGFVEGDALLQMTARLLEKNMKPNECCARVFSDQFVLLLRYSGWSQMETRIRSINSHLNELLTLKNRQYHLKMAFGVYVVENKEQQDISLMLDLANYAKKSAKNSHNSLMALYDQKMRKNELFERDLADDMERALKAGEFIPYFQPKTHMGTREIVGSEALVRWVRPGQEAILPGVFIPFFERNGFIVEIDLYMYEAVCKIIRRWMDEGQKIYPVSCNFSRLHFRNDSFPQEICTIADKYEIPHHYLELEITESVVMDNLEQVLHQFDMLKEMNFSISIDDFGSGYSSLGMLQQLSVDVIKIDRSFLREGLSSARDQVIIRGIVTMAHELNMVVVCEGVESQDQADILLGMGCFVAQSFYYARPMPCETFEKMLQLNKEFGSIL